MSVFPDNPNCRLLLAFVIGCLESSAYRRATFLPYVLPLQIPKRAALHGRAGGLHVRLTPPSLIAHQPAF